jgi:hypothetical protein
LSISSPRKHILRSQVAALGLLLLVVDEGDTVDVEDVDCDDRGRRVTSPLAIISSIWSWMVVFF